MADTDEPSVDACSDIEMSAFCVVLLREGLTELWQEFAPCVENPLHGSDKPIRSHGLDKLADVRSKASFVGLMCEKSIPVFRYLFIEPHRLISMRNAAQVLDLDRMAGDYLDLVNEVDIYIPQVSGIVPFERQKIVAKAVICDVAKWVMLPKDTQDSYWLDSNLIGWSDGPHPLHQNVAPHIDVGRDNIASLKSRIPPMPQLPGGKNSPRLLRCFWQNANWGVEPPCCDAREICCAIWPEESRTDIESLKGNRLSRTIHYLNNQFLDLDIAITFHEAGDDVTMEDYRK